MMIRLFGTELVLVASRLPQGSLFSSPSIGGLAGS